MSGKPKCRQTCCIVGCTNSYANSSDAFVPIHFYRFPSHRFPHQRERRQTWIQNLMYSNYKGTYTAKFLIGIAPNGVITFMSRAYGGRATDAFITVDSGLFSLLEPEYVVLADKGFPGVRIDAAEANAILVMPPFSSGGNFTAEEMAETYKVASVRIHVERMIQRVKNFNIVNVRLPLELHDHIDRVMHVICILVNLQSGIFRRCE